MQYPVASESRRSPVKQVENGSISAFAALGLSFLADHIKNGFGAPSARKQLFRAVLQNLDRRGREMTKRVGRRLCRINVRKGGNSQTENICVSHFDECTFEAGIKVFALGASL
jgi:hypothetical protein